MRPAATAAAGTGAVFASAFRLPPSLQQGAACLSFLLPGGFAVVIKGTGACKNLLTFEQMFDTMSS